MTYVTPLDMKALYNPETLVQATNYADPSATVINEAQLQTACDMGSAIADGYLALLPLDPSNFNDRFKAILRTYCARLALDSLDGASADPQIRKHAEESISWLESLTKLSIEALKRLAENVDQTPQLPIDISVPSVFVVNEGRCWDTTFDSPLFR